MAGMGNRLDMNKVMANEVHRLIRQIQLNNMLKTRIQGRTLEIRNLQWMKI